MSKAQYRHEFKYPVSEAEIALIENRLKYFAEKDSHIGERGFYNISSLYFDDAFDSCLQENIDGTDPREKFRIRIYNHYSGRITLECKRKERGKTLKTSCKLTTAQTEKVLSGEYLRDISTQPDLLKKFTMQMMTRGLKPKVIVEYDRIPYIYKNGNVRITFDTNLSSSLQSERFLVGATEKRPVMPKGVHLLEVKWDDYLPATIYDAIQIDNLTQMAYSKYYLCRKFTDRR